jgi:hypothetical protein
MKKIFISFLVSSLCWAHGEGVNELVSLHLKSSQEISSSLEVIKFELIHIKKQTPVTDLDLSITHEKLLHVFIFDKGLGEFQHLHPEFKDGLWFVEASFSRKGDYILWSQAMLKKEGEDFTSNTSLTVTEGACPNPTPPELTDLRTGSEGNSVISLTQTRFRVGKEALPNITFSRNDETLPDIGNYLGEKAHVVITPENSDSLIHTHPMDHGVPNQVMLHMTFPEVGFYRMWVQFIDAGQLRVIPLSVEVFE